MMCQMNQLSQMNQEQLLNFINVVSFQVIDTQLYLDSHTQDEEAIGHFNYYMELRRNALQLYADQFGPLTIDTANPTNCWKWAEQPWPWEGGNC